MIGGRELKRLLREQAGANQQRRCQGKMNCPSDGGQNHLSCPLRIFLATLLRPSTSRSASARVMSGVNDNMPPAMRWVMKGAASQRPSASVSPHWPKMTKCFPGLAAEYCSRIERADSVKLNFDGKAALRVNDPGRDDVGFRQNRLPGDGEGRGIGAQNGNRLAGAGIVGIDFNVYAQGADFLARFVFGPSGSRKAGPAPSAPEKD